MADIKVNKKRGPKPVTFDEKKWKEFDNLCAMQCTEIEICGWFDITDKTLARVIDEKYHRKFSEVFRQKRSKGLVSLRRAQFQLAQTNPAMAIFLGKNYLGQADKQEIEHTGGVKIIRDNI